MGPLLILICTLIWGTAFLAQKSGAEHFGPLSLTCLRNLLATAFLATAIAIHDRFARAPWRMGRSELVGGTLSGLVLFGAMTAQQIGIESTTPGVSAFLTANYILFVPVLAWLTGRSKPGRAVIIGVVLALAGSYLISVRATDAVFAIGPGELWTLLCAVLFAVQIMVVDRFARKVDIVRFSIVQLFAAALFSAPFILLPSELARASWSGFAAGLPALLYIGLLSSGVAYTLQNLGQARTPPALAAIIMSMESVFSALFAWLLRDVTMPPRQILGCALVFAAVILAQLPLLRRR